MKAYLKIKEKIKDQHYLDDIQDFKKKAEKLKQKTNVLGFLSQKEGHQNFYFLNYEHILTLKSKFPCQLIWLSKSLKIRLT